MPELVVEFVKMHGAGNDFVVIDNRFFVYDDELLSRLARAMCPRRTGVGADGLLAMDTEVAAGIDFRMKYFNADGSRGEMCGNGARCLVRFAVDAGVESRPVRFLTDEGIHTADLIDGAEDGAVRLYVPDPSGYRESVFLQGDAAPDVGPVTALFTGVPHAVCFVDDARETPVAQWGAAIRHDPAFPEGTNVDFVERTRRGCQDLAVRTFERGVEAETPACGTGAIAAALCAARSGGPSTGPIQVRMPGGILNVGFKRRGAEFTDVYLEGPAVRVFRGTFAMVP